MKNVLFSFSALIFSLCSLSRANAQSPATPYTQSNLYAHLQSTAYWKGGQPGHATDWNFAKNWSTNTVPNEFTNVVIPDVSTQANAYPVLEDTDAEVNSLVILSGAGLTIQPNSALSVLTTVEKVGNARLNVKGVLSTETAGRDGMAVRR